MDLSDVECTTPWAALQCDFWVTFSRLTARGRFLALGRKLREMRRFSLRDASGRRKLHPNGWPSASRDVCLGVPSVADEIRPVRFCGICCSARALAGGDPMTAGGWNRPLLHPPPLCAPPEPSSFDYFLVRMRLDLIHLFGGVRPGRMK